MRFATYKKLSDLSEKLISLCPSPDSRQRELIHLFGMLG
jgi:hypothetical protein